MTAQFGRALAQLRPLDQEGLASLVAEKLRPPFDYHGLVMLRERATRERDLRELYRGRAPYELLQNADDAGATRAAFVLNRDGLAFLHNGNWFTTGDFENLALGWSDKDPNVCIGNKGLGFRSVLDVTPSPHVIRVDAAGFFGVKFSYSLNKGHIDEALRREPQLHDEVSRWGSNRTTCPVMSIPGPVRRQSLSSAAAAILERAPQGAYGGTYTTLFWLPAGDPDIAADVLRNLGPTPLTLDTGREALQAFLTDEVSELVLFLQHILEVRLYDDRTLKATVTIPAESRSDVDMGSVITELEGRRHVRNYFQVRASVPIPNAIRNQPDTSGTLKSMSNAHVAVLLEVDGGRPVADPEARFHVYFPTEESTGVGFLVHGDFYVKPDRTRLMQGAYNDWLFREAARLAAGPFLTSLLARYRPRDVFESLRPAVPAAAAGQRFLESFRQALRSRLEPFIPTPTGLGRPAEVVMPQAVDNEGAWETCIGHELSRTRNGQRFLLATEDSRDARAFLELSGVERLSPSAFLDLVESAAHEPRSPSWWYGCYSHISAHPEIGRWTVEQFAGRQIVPIIGGTVAAVPSDTGGAVLVLPPRGRTDLPKPPRSFERMVEFVEPGLSDLLWEGHESVRSWVTSRFHVATYEVTDFLQRVVQAVAPLLFGGDSPPDADELLQIWTFVRGSVEAAVRPIHDESFWDVIGRLPLPVSGSGRIEKIEQADLAPAFLTYFPDEWLQEDDALVGVGGLRRVAPDFLRILSPKVDSERTAWRQFLQQAGVSGGPKLRRYRRVVPGPLLLLKAGLQTPTLSHRFQGHRQHDENSAVLELLEAEQLWPILVADAPRCENHPQQVGLAEVALVEGLAATVAEATDEHRRGESRWSGRLHQLARQLEVEDINVAEVVTACQQCHREARAPGGAVTQLERHYWVPTSFGPWSKNDAFLRLVGQRLVGLEPDGAELGDKLLPYLVAETIDDYGRFATLGVAPLDSAANASATTLLRFLAAIGRALSSEGPVDGILLARSRWRLVRGAIQEAYRALNRQVGSLELPDGLRLAVRSTGGPQFLPMPWHFAEPGSVIERAFHDRLRIVDADRAYASLFRELGIAPLVSGQTVSEDLIHTAETAPADRLRNQIVDSLARHLLALLVSRSEDPEHPGLVARRLRERFSVRTALSLQLELALIDGSARAEITVEPFYLQRSVVETQGSRREANFTLYAVADPNTDLIALDGDALGVALVPVFLDGFSEELSPLFPRVVARFQRVEGNEEDMATFLLEQLGISAEAQETAAELLRGNGIPRPGHEPPAPKIVIGHGSGAAGALDAALGAALANLQQTAQKIQDQVAARLSRQGGAHGGGDGGGGGHAAGGGQPVTREQEARGQRGEEELKRRLQQTEGWGSFRLIRDRRAEGCGYDFMCDAGGTESHLEVKTFLAGGRVVVTLRELQEAYARRRTYYLVGLCDDGGPASGWQTFVLQDPIESLLRVGDFQLETKVEAPAEKLFEFE